VDLSDAELRVLGSLVEKQLTTPQQYPLTLNALALACSQSSNRDPVVAYDEPAVDAAVTSVKTRGLAGFVHPSHGRSALRFRHALDEALGLDARPLALLAVLMLRGPQTPGELRVRTERMVGFSDLSEVQSELDALSARTEPLVVRLPRAPGQKEDRYAQLLGGPVEVHRMAPVEVHRIAPVEVHRIAPVEVHRIAPDLPLPADLASTANRSSAADPSSGDRSSAAGRVLSAALADDVAGLRAEVDALRAELGELRRAFDDLRGQLGD
jgi:hypothetical protein